MAGGGDAAQREAFPGEHVVITHDRIGHKIAVRAFFHLANSVAMRSGGEVRVTARIADGLEIIVSDSGTGISKADLERLGRPFEQVENADTRAKEGTGLGLALVKSLALLHGGEAVLESALGEGTAVTVRLPHAGVDAQGERIADAKVLPFRAVS